MNKKLRQSIAQNCSAHVVLVPSLDSDIPFRFSAEDYRRSHEEIAKKFREDEILEYVSSEFSDNEGAGEIHLKVSNEPVVLVFDYVHGVINQKRD